MSNNIIDGSITNTSRNDSKIYNNASKLPIASPILTTNSILQIRFDASTINGLILQDHAYTPSMSNPQVYMAFPTVLFIPTIRLNRNMFDQYLGEDDIKKVFLSPAQFNNFIERKVAKTIYKSISLSDADKKGIIHSNILFILNLFFKKGDRLVIYDTKYVVNTYRWNSEYKFDIVPGENASIFKIKLDLMLQEGSDISFIDSTRLNCIQKKNDIIHDYYVLSGLTPPSNKIADLKFQPVDKRLARKKREVTTKSSRKRSITNGVKNNIK